MHKKKKQKSQIGVKKKTKAVPMHVAIGSRINVVDFAMILAN